MSHNFAAIGQQNYIGTPYVQAVKYLNIAGQGVPLLFQWISYGASSVNPNINAYVDLSPQQVSARLGQIRSLYIDNLGSDTPIYIQFPDTLYTVVAKPNSTGWYPVYTNQLKFNVLGIGFSSGDVGETRVLATNIFVSPSVNEEYGSGIDLYRASPIISIAGGAPIASIAITYASACYIAGTLSISGGGGSAAAASGTLDVFGSFTNVTVTNPGANYSASPTVTATGARALPPWYNGGAFYPAGSVVFDFSAYGLGTLWQMYQTPAGAPPSGTGLIEPAYWIAGPYLGSVPPAGPTLPAAPTFLTTLGAPVGRSFAQPVYNAPVLGDQIWSRVTANIAAPALFENNVFNSPYGTGFIYITALEMNIVIANGTGPYIWQLDNANGDVIFKWSFIVGSASYTTTGLSRLQNQNIKLDATQTYRINGVTIPAGLQLNYHFAYTWSAG